MRKRGTLSKSVHEIGDNEFIEEEQQPIRSFSKDLRIKKLQERNVKLQEEVIRIERALSGMQAKTQYGIRLPEIKGDVIRKELENAYKMIKQYQYQMAKRKRNDLEGAYVDQVRKSERVLKEKEDIAEKLRKEVAQIKKLSGDYVRLLRDDAFRNDQAQKEATIRADVQWLHQQIKRLQGRKNIFNASLDKQQQQIQKIEKELTLKHSFDNSTFENMRNRIFTAVPPTRQISQSDEELEPLDLHEQLPEDRSPQTYAMILTEVRLFKKLQKDNETKLQLLLRQKQEAEDRNFKSRNRLLQTQYEIERVQARIVELKSQLDPKALIPKKMKMINQEKRKYASSVTLRKPKLTMVHLYPSQQVGEASKAGKRFIDRVALGKKIAKIVAVTFYQNIDGNQNLFGLQATYEVGGHQKKGLMNMLADPSSTEPKECTLQAGDYVRSIDCLLNQKGEIVGVSMVSVKNAVMKGGTMTAHRQGITMTPHEYPVCLFGCLLPNGIQMLGAQFVAE